MYTALVTFLLAPLRKMHTSFLAPGSPASAPATSSSLRDMATDVANMLKAFIGLNFMYVAYAFSNAGLTRGALGLVLITLLTEHCCLLLVRVKNVMPGHALDPAPAHYRPLSDSEEDPVPADAITSTTVAHPPQYGDIAHFVGGLPAHRLVTAALILTQFGYCVAYLIFLSSTMHHMLPDNLQAHISLRWFVLFPLPVLACVAMLASIRSLGPFSIIANAALLVSFVAVVVFIAQHYSWQPSHPPLSKFPLFFGQMTAALEGIGLVIPVESSMRNRAGFPLVLRIALVMLTTVLMVVGVLGYVTFGENTSSIILRNFGKTPLVAVVKAILVVGILFTYPLQIVPVFQFVESIFIKNGIPVPTDTELERYGDESGAESSTEFDSEDGNGVSSLFVQDPRRVAIRMIIILGTAAVAMLAGKQFGLFQSLVGSLGASCLAYTAPALFHFFTFRETSSPAVKAKDIAIVIFGILGAVFGTTTSIMAFVNGEGEGE